MSKIALSPDAAGTGTFTLASPNGNTNRTITLPDGDVTLGAATPSITDNGNATAITIDANENVGIGESNPTAKIHATTTTSGPISAGAARQGSVIKLHHEAQWEAGYNSTPTDFLGALEFSSGDDSGSGLAGEGVRAAIRANVQDAYNNVGLTFETGGTRTERMRIDSSGNLLAGKTSADYTTAGVMLEGDGTISSVKAGVTAVFNRLSSDGDIALFRKSGTTVASIGVAAGDNFYIAGGSGSTKGIYFNNTGMLPANTGGALIDNTVDIGKSDYRFDDIYATNGTIQTSDRNEKQDIEVLTAAETAVAVACKGLLRKFRWIDSVTEKGDDARIHFGIIAQDLQDAFTAEGLDAGRYAMFISSTWWETQTDVPAVVAVDEVLDEDGNVVTEAVEAKDAYTRTDTFDTLAEAPEGATERTRLGVRYPELLAFIIGAM